MPSCARCWAAAKFIAQSFAIKHVSAQSEQCEWSNGSCAAQRRASGLRCLLVLVVRGEPSVRGDAGGEIAGWPSPSFTEELPL